MGLRCPRPAPRDPRGRHRLRCRANPWHNVTAADSATTLGNETFAIKARTSALNRAFANIRDVKDGMERLLQSAKACATVATRVAEMGVSCCASRHGVARKLISVARKLRETAGPCPVLRRPPRPRSSRPR